MLSAEPVGTILNYAAATSPSGWLICDGSAIPRTTYADLFTAISTIWGVGDGSSTFNLPDLRGAFLRGSGTGTINGRNKTAVAVGSFQEDQFQGHYHRVRTYGGTATYRISRRADNGPTVAYYDSEVLYPTPDGINGNPRYSDQTNPYNASVQFCIKF